MLKLVSLPLLTLRGKVSLGLLHGAGCFLPDLPCCVCFDYPVPSRTLTRCGGVTVRWFFISPVGGPAAHGGRINSDQGWYRQSGGSKSCWVGRPGLWTTAVEHLAKQSRTA